MISQYFAHGGSVEPEETEVSGGFLDALTHLPAWASLLIIAFVLFGLYTLLEKFNIKPLNRVLLLIPLLLLIAIVYMQHSPIVSTVVLSAGFVASFAIAFTLLSGDQSAGKEDAKKS